MDHFSDLVREREAQILEVRRIGKPRRALLPTVFVIADPSGESEKGWRRTQK
jgi:hypothetical protein